MTAELLTVSLYWSFRSPYSYVVLPRVIALQHRFLVEIDLRIVHPAAIRNPAYFARMDALARPYFLRDSARVAAFHGLPFRRPVPDPITQDPVSLEIAAEQPLARQLGYLGIAAVEQGRGLAFAADVSTLLWDGRVTGWDQGEHLCAAAARAGLRLQDLIQAINGREADYEARLAANGEALRAAGHWGVPTFVFEDEPFFGQDRFDLLMWRLRQRGLQARAG